MSPWSSPLCWSGDIPSSMDLAGGPGRPSPPWGWRQAPGSWRSCAPPGGTQGGPARNWRSIHQLHIMRQYKERVAVLYISPSPRLSGATSLCCPWQSHQTLQCRKPGKDSYSSGRWGRPVQYGVWWAKSSFLMWAFSSRWNHFLASNVIQKCRLWAILTKFRQPCLVNQTLWSRESCGKKCFSASATKRADGSQLCCFKKTKKEKYINCLPNFLKETNIVAPTIALQKKCSAHLTLHYPIVHWWPGVPPWPWSCGLSWRSPTGSGGQTSGALGTNNHHEA